MNTAMQPVAQNLATHCTIFGIKPATITTYREAGIEFGGATVRVGDQPELWTTAVLGAHYQEAGALAGGALQIADKHVAVLRNMNADRFTVQGNHTTGFSVGFRRFGCEADAVKHAKHLHSVMALDALTGGLYFGVFSESGVVTYNDRLRNLFSRRGAMLIERHLGDKMGDDLRGRLQEEKWYWDLGTAARGKGEDPLAALLRGGHNESPLFWGIMFRMRFMARAHVERANPRLKEMLGIQPRTY